MEARARRNYMYKERIVHIEFKISRLGILGKEYYELAQIKLKRHRVQISIAKTQNSLLHAALDTLREKDRIARKNAGDLENLRKQAATLRVQFDHQRQRVMKRHRQLEWQITGTHSTELECAGVLDPNTTPDLAIRSLEAKLARVQIRMQDVQMLVRQYEATLHPLRDEWTLYDAKLGALQDQLNLKNRECESLINTHHDAIRARDAAKFELEEGLISPDLRFWILRAIRDIKTVMDVNSMREMYNQYLVQEKQSAYLESIFEDMSHTLHLLRDDDYRRTRKKSSIKERDREDIARMIGGTTLMVRRQSEWRGAYPLLQVLDGTRNLVDRLHEGQHIFQSSRRPVAVLEKCRLAMIQIIQALYRQLKRKNKKSVRRAEYEAKEAVHWQREADEVARKNKAAEDARRKYEARAATREAILEREEKEALHQTKQYQEAPHDIEEEYQARGDDPSNLKVDTTSQDSEGIISSANDYLLSQYYQLAKETQVEQACSPTVIFLPARGGSTTSDRASEAPDGVAVLPSDESPGATTADDARQDRATPSPDTDVAFAKTSPTTMIDRIGSAAEALDIETVPVSDQGERTVESPAEPASGALSAEEGISSTETPPSAVCTTPTESELEPCQLQTEGRIPEETVLVQEGGAESVPPSPDEGGPPVVTTLSSESTPVEKHGEETAALTVSCDKSSQEEGMTQEKPVEVTSSDIVMSRALPSTTVSGLLSDETLQNSAYCTPGMTSRSSDTAEAIPEGIASATTAAFLGDERVVVQIFTEGKLPAVSAQSMDVASIPSPGDGHDWVPTGGAGTEAKPSGIETQFVVGLRLPQEAAAAEIIPSTPDDVSRSEEKGISSGRDESAGQSPRPAEVRLPRSASGAPIASGVKLLPVETLLIDETLPQRNRSPSLPRSPSGAPVATAASFPLEPLSLPLEESISHSSTPNLPRSPSGAPIASAARFPIEPLSLSRDKSLSQRSVPSLPRSPSGAPIATSARFPLEPLSLSRDESIHQRSRVAALSETSSPGESSTAGGTFSLGEPVPTEAKLPEGVATSDPQE